MGDVFSSEKCTVSYKIEELDRAAVELGLIRYINDYINVIKLKDVESALRMCHFGGDKVLEEKYRTSFKYLDGVNFDNIQISLEMYDRPLSEVKGRSLTSSVDGLCLLGLTYENGEQINFRVYLKKTKKRGWISPQLVSK